MIKNSVNNKYKSYAVFSFSIFSLGTFIGSANFAVMICSEWLGLTAGLFLTVLAVLLHLLARKHPFAYSLSFFLNFIACGFSVSAYYLTKNLQTDLLTMLISAIPAAVLLMLVYLMLQVFSKKAALFAAAAANAVLLAASAVFWTMTDRLFFSFGFFCLLISSFSVCVFGLTINHDERPVLRDISYGSFGAFVAVTIVVIAVLTEGECLDISDIFGGNGKKNKEHG